MRDNRLRREPEEDEGFESDMVRHYKALFFQRNQEESVDSDGQINAGYESKLSGLAETSNYHRLRQTRAPKYENYAHINADFVNRESGFGLDGSESSGYNWIDKYKANIVPPHMKRTNRPVNQSNNYSSGSESQDVGSNSNPARSVLNSNPMSTLSPQEIPPYFSPPTLLRKEKRTFLNVTENENEDMNMDKSQMETAVDNENDTETGEDETSITSNSGEEAKEEPRDNRTLADSKSSMVPQENDIESEKRELQMRLNAAEAKLVEQDAISSSRIAELETTLKYLNDMKLDDKGRKVNMQRQLTNLTAERQERLLALRKLEEEKAALEAELVQKKEIIEVLKTKDKLLSGKIKISEQKRIEMQSEIEAERATMANTNTNKRLKDALFRISELEALNHALRESIKQKH
uniref:Uncharacterized protein n=1 Tax=Aplanochytrium stocchinoi TaxID=215587 RepID=A0A7S3PF08_9STRA|mmetsp:Transcript_7297/g.9539  ORF Transcript_7297/g.9539 Transcript_7297/m.9539 type:complete len:407 (+) Transcript_7297:308-1528(+)